MRRAFRAVLAALSSLLCGLTAGAAETSFYPATVDAKTGLPVTPARFTSASECATCHPLQHAQWQGSMHAHAFEDPLYQGVLREASRDTGGKVDRFCTGCHTPVGSAQEMVWVRGSGEVVIHPLANEGVTCDFCHTVAEVRLLEKGGTPRNAGLVVNPDGPKRGPYGDADDTFHAVAYSNLHTTSEFCAACHNVFHPVGNAAIARTYEEWKGSIYAQKGIQCQDCHMVPPSVAAQVASTLEPVVSKGLASVFSGDRSPFYEHTFTGANAAIPALLNHWQTVNDARARLQIAAKVTVSVPPGVKTGGALPIEVRVENLRAGHNLPTSMSEIREMWLHATLEDEGDGGKLVWESGGVSGKGSLDPQARRFGIRAVDAAGQPTWKPWKIDRIEKDTSIPPRGTAAERFEVLVPDGVKGPLNLLVRLRYRSFSQEVAEQYLSRPGWRVPIVTMAEASARVTTAASQ